MPDGAPAAKTSRLRALSRHPFLWGGLVVLAVLAALFAIPRADGPAWPPVLHIREADAIASNWVFRETPDGPVVPLSWSSSRTNTKSTNGVVDAFDAEFVLFPPATDPLEKFLTRLGPWREPERTYLTTGEMVEKEGVRWRVIRPK